MAMELLSIAWSVIEGSIALAAGIMSHSVALTGFGFDSLIEIASAVAVHRRLRLEHGGRGDQSVERIEKTTPGSPDS